MLLTRRESLLAASAAALLPARALGAKPSDVAILRRAYTMLHPGLYRYSSAQQVNARLNALEGGMGKARTDRERYLALSRFLATVRCGHTYANFVNQSKAIQSALFSNPDRLRFWFLRIDGKMIVTRDFSGQGIAPGTEISAIDGRSAAEILARLMSVARADGSNDGKRRSLLSVKGGDRFESFDVFYPLLFGSRERYRLLLKQPDGATGNLTVKTISLEARRAESESLSKRQTSDAVWSFETRGKAGLLTMPDWALYDSKWDWHSWLDTTFSEIEKKQLTGLVIDLRANEGGLDCGDEVVARLIDAPVARNKMRRLVRYRRVPDDLRPYLETWDKSFFDWGADAQPFDGRFFTLSSKDSNGGDDNLIKPKGPRFGGRVAVLIGPENSSATFQFAALVQREKLCVLVGEETGGNLRGINGGAFFFLRLPHSGFEADLPLIGTFPMTDMPDRGLLPDVEVTRTPQSIASGDDRALNRALALVLS